MRLPLTIILGVFACTASEPVPSSPTLTRGSPGSRVRRAPEGSRPPADVSTPEAAARFFLGQELADDAVVTHVHDLGRGGTIVALRRRIDGVDVIRADAKVLLDRGLGLVAISGDLPDRAIRPRRDGFRTTAADALAASLGVGKGDVVDLGEAQGDYEYFGLADTAAVRLVERARVKKVYFPTGDRLEPAWFVETLSRKGAGEREAWDRVFSAVDGTLLFENDLVKHEAFSYRVFADADGDHRPADGPIADFSPYPTGMPDGSYPAYAAPNLVSIDGFNAQHDPWLPASATTTTGNNVDAYTDDDAPDGFSGLPDLRATTTSPGVFDRTYDVIADPQSSDDQKMAAVTDLFYVTNWLHDWWYDSGFDEAAGNAQQDNFGRGGVGGDPLLAEAQDGAPAQRDNSNMDAMSEGASPRMQMFVWDGAVSSTLSVTSSGTLGCQAAGFGPADAAVTAAVVLAVDGTAPTSDACEAITGDVNGKIAVIDRGTCTFKEKAVSAQSAGAAGAIIVNNDPNDPEGLPPLGDDLTNMTAVTIPVVGISLTEGDALKAALSGSVSATLDRHAEPSVDGTIDNTVVAHEWGHYLHLRLVNCASNQCGAQSEGWGDFVALQMMAREGDDLHGTFAEAQYAAVGLAPNAAYFGIRRVPYSVDMTKNPLTFIDIVRGQTLPTTAPMSETGGSNSEVHNAGEIWALMLWQGYVALLERSQGETPAYSFDEARRRMSDYVVGGLKLAPVDPTYTEQRDAILAAANAADPADMEALAQAFAVRGAGSCAESPARSSRNFSGVKEDFTVKPVVTLTSRKLDDSVTACAGGNGVLDAGETGVLTLKLTNGGALAWNGTVTVTSDTTGVTFPDGGAVSMNVAPFTSGEATVKVAVNPSVAAAQAASFHLAIDPPASCDGSSAIDTAVEANFAVAPMTAASDDVEADASAWTPTGTDAPAIWTRTEPTPADHAWNGVDFGSPSDTSLVSPALTVGSGDFTIAFDHRHEFENSTDRRTGTVTNWDGAVIEISTDNGATWNDLSMYGDPGYGGTIGDPTGGATNALATRNGYVATNAAWPARDHVMIDLGTTLAGQTVLVRFRIASDDAGGAFGWEIDNLAFGGITNLPFPSIVASTACTEKLPSSESGGCGCRVGSGRPVSGLILVGIFGAVLLGARRRRR